MLLIRARRLSQIYYYKNIYTICMHKNFSFYVSFYACCKFYSLNEQMFFILLISILHLICIFLVYKLFTQSKIFSFIGKKYKTSDYLQMLFQVLLTKLGYHLFTILLKSIPVVRCSTKNIKNTMCFDLANLQIHVE